MSQSESDSCPAGLTPPLLESQFSTELHIYEPGDEDYPPAQAETPQTPQEDAPTPPGSVPDGAGVAQRAVWTTRHQLAPKTSSGRHHHAKNRHHTTVVTFPVGLEKAVGGSRGRHSAQGPDVSWEDYDSDGDGFALRRNRRNKSYRAAVTSLDIEALGAAARAAPALLKPVKEGRASSPGPARSPGRKRTLGRKRNQRGSFKNATPCLYQEIRERGLHSTNQDELLEDFVVVEPAVEDQGIVVKSYRPAQLTWSQLPQVKDTDILSRITPQERKRQEAIFEIITSEHSYLHSLGILKKNLPSSLFLPHSFFEDLEQRHNENPVIREISDIVQNHSSHHFDPYIVYCSNETFQQRTLQALLNNNAAFKETLKKIEASGECGGLPMLSFLILPMQRVTRLPLLLDTICQKTPANTAEYFAAVWALNAMSKLVTSCNDGARRMERTEQMYTIQKQMDFGKIKPFPLVSASRWIKKRGELAISAEELSIWRAFSNKSYYLFLFNDVLIVTRKKREKANKVGSEEKSCAGVILTSAKSTAWPGSAGGKEPFVCVRSEESFVVLDYDMLENVQVEVGEDAEGRMSPPAKNSTGHLSFKLRMSKNSEGRSEQLSLVAASRVDRARWIVALTEHKQMGVTCTDGLPQYEATKAYMPKEPDELGLRQAELVIVLQKEEAWCYGERMRDGGRGWFPASCATEITNPTAMESNVQRMKRLRKETNV
ncbi:unnamed protein product [Menidia menidia]|uniref:(Atlantic silverside) hypothetical protein n=1 Tax=Menidia menidia TaxID=238744 RepID=A0A8S4C2K0_9TELE|nr:unnamed protein product [Menidia menidia]